MAVDAGVVLGVANDTWVVPGVERLRGSVWNGMGMALGRDGVRECVENFVGDGGSGMSSGRSAEPLARGGGSIADIGGEMGRVMGVEAS